MDSARQSHRALAALALIACTALPGCDKRIELGPGVYAAEPPWQSDNAGNPFEKHGFQLTPRADLALTAKVLGKRRYRFDELAVLVPWDFALGWGALSDETWLAGTRVTQGGRFMYWHLYETPLNLSLVERSSANMHLIPANKAVKEAMSAVAEGAIVHLRGRLVDLRLPDGERVIPTSLTRLDRGPGACEIVFVEHLSIEHSDAG